MRRLGWVVLLVMGIANAVHAADPAQKQDAAPAPPTATFVAEAAQGNQFEIVSSTLALQRSDQVKAFANHMISDHTTAAEKLKRVLEQEHLTAPSDQLDAKHKAALEDLNGKLDSPAFDKAYVEAQYRAHRAAVDLFKAYGKGGESRALRRLADELLPTLQAHLAAVEKLR